MIPNITYICPSSIEEALSVLTEKNNSAKIIAGGTDIIPGFQIQSKRFTDIKTLVDINNIESVKEIKMTENELSIGAAATFTQILNNRLITDNYPLLKKAASAIGSVQIRNRATIGGNFINNAPCADSVPPLLVYDAKIHIQSIGGDRIISLQDFLLNPYQTQLQHNEIITKISLPKVDENFRGDFYKLGRRRALTISRITLAILVKADQQYIKDIRIAGGAVTPIGKRFYELENELKNKSINSDLFKDAAQKMGKQILDLTGLRWSSPYKLPVVQQVLYQMLMDLCLGGEE